MQGRAVYYAQHATATCCRKCMEYWHGIPKDRPLTDGELAYATMLVQAYLDDRLTDLPDDPVLKPLQTKLKWKEIPSRTCAPWNAWREFARHSALAPS
jgi:hypothetical protein